MATATRTTLRSARGASTARAVKPDTHRPDGPADGRRQRSHDSQQRIVEALLTLVSEGHLSPSAEQVSERAGVGLRSVFRHFKDMESLHKAASVILSDRLEQAAREPFKAVDWHARLFELIDRRAKVYEQLAPFLRAAQVHRSTSRVLQAGHLQFVAVLRRILFERLPAGLAIPPETLEGVDLLLSFEAWQRLRHEQRLGSSQARVVLRAAIAALMAPYVRGASGNGRRHPRK